jgi:hypothetical protein
VASIASAPSPIDRSDFHGSIMLKDMTSDRMTIMIDCSEPITGVRIVNQTGQIMNELAIPETANTFAASLPIGRFASGVYFVHAVCMSGYVARKFEVKK